MKLKRGSTSVRRLIFIADSSSTTGAGLASLVYNSASLVAYYFAGDLSNEVQITLATATLGTFASGGFIAVDNTNMPGWYEIGIPDAALDGGNEVCIQLRGATNMVPVNIYIELDAVDYQNATNFGLSKFADIETDTQDIQSRIPAALTADGNIKADMLRVNGTAQTARDLGANIDVATSTRMATYTQPTGFLAASFPTDPADQSLIIDATNALLAAINALNNLSAAQVWSAGTRTLTSGANIALAKGTGVTGFNDIAATDIVSAGAITTSSGAVTLTSAERTSIAAAVWNALTSGLTTVGSIGKRLVDLFSGMTNLPNWLGAMAGKQTPNSTALAEINATGAGSGDYSATTDSQQALRDNYSTGGDTILVSPLLSTLRGNDIVSSGTTQAFRYTPLPSGPIVVIDADDAPINLSAAAVKMISVNTSVPTDTWTLTEATGLSVGGASSNEVSVDYLPTFCGKYKWWLYYQPSGETDWIVAGFGIWDIGDAPDPR